jgi:SAM-dependent methyltransferase
MSGDWFLSWFNSPYYQILYNHRNDEEAKQFIDKLITFLKPDENSSILDVACGRGRHANYLAEKGFKVIGTDIHEANIQFANKNAVNGASFYTQDMREGFMPGRFDLVLNLFTSFGYFDTDTDNQNALNSMAASLKTGGIFVMDFLNANLVRQKLVADETLEKEGVEFKIKRYLSNNIIHKEIEFSAKGKAQKFIEKVQALGREDLIKYIENAGLEILNDFGDYDLNAFEPDSSARLILIAQKKNHA